MKERPILFSGPMVRAILEGRKTQTRRVILPQPPGEGYQLSTMVSTTADKRNEGKQRWVKVASDGHTIEAAGDQYFTSPYEPGDRLWVRETWRLWEHQAFDGFEPADPNILTGSLAGFDQEYLQSRPVEYKADSLDDGPWRPSIFMPKWATRLWLEVVGVRPERLQDISEADAKAEGAQCVIWHHPYGKEEGESVAFAYARPYPKATYKAGFANLWDSLNGKRGFSWEQNPVVRGTEFMVEGEQSA